MSSLGVSVCVFWFIAASTPALAQTNRLFQWSFANDALSTSLPTCFPLQIIVTSFNTTTNDTIGTPPYYMTAFVVGGTPVTTFIGTDQNNLTWTVTEPVGSQLVLSVVDANGSAGGIPPNIYKVIEGTTTQCVTTPINTPPFTVTANVTSDLQTCQPWGFKVKGGVPPYVITFAQPGSPVVTNVSMLFGDDAFTFINRAGPNGQLIGAISDLTGRWATGTPIVNTKGSTDDSCVGLASSSGKSSDIPENTPKKNHALAVGLSVTLLLVFFMTLGVGGFIYLRRHRREKEELFIATIPHQFIPVEPRIPTVPASQQAPTSMSGRIPFDKASSGRGVTIPSEIYRNPPSPEDNTTIPSNGGISYYPSIITSSNVTNGPTPTDNPPRYLVSPARKSPGGFTNFPSTSIRRSAKSLEASTQSAVSPDSEYVLESAISDSSNVLGRQLSAVSSARTANTARGFRPEDRVEEEAETIYQHRNGGVVRELPPPYMDRGDSEGRSNQ